MFAAQSTRRSNDGTRLFTTERTVQWEYEIVAFLFLKESMLINGNQTRIRYL